MVEREKKKTFGNIFLARRRFSHGFNRGGGVGGKPSASQKIYESTLQIPVYKKKHGVTK